MAAVQTLLVLAGTGFLYASAFNKNFRAVSSLGLGAALIATAVFVAPLLQRIA